MVHVFKKGGYWYIRFRQNEVGADGKIIRKQRARKLARISEYRSRKAVEELAEEKLLELQVNTAIYNPQSTMTLSQFVDGYFMPVHVAQLKPSVRPSYECNWERHLKPLCGDIRLRDFRTSTGQQGIDELPKRSIGRNTMRRFKSLLSGIFSEAIRLGILDTGNPMREVRIPTMRVRPPGETHAYSPEQVAVMLKNIIGPARAVIAVFAYTGLRKGEVAALRWENWRNGLLYVEQSAWRTQFTDPKSAMVSPPFR